MPKQIYIVVQANTISDFGGHLDGQGDDSRQSSAGLTTLVNNKIKEGYIVQGGLTCMARQGSYMKDKFYQSMILAPKS